MTLHVVRKTKTGPLVWGGPGLVDPSPWPSPERERMGNRYFAASLPGAMPLRGGFPPYWQASQSGLSMLHACGTGAGFGSAERLSSITEDTALSLPVLMVDFSVLVAARARR
ncbi:hypothetical protein D3C85_1217420 [compost metagenome]